MKKIKISMVAIMAVIIALVGSAFTVKKSVKLEDTFYYKYSLTSSEGLLTESNWDEVESVMAGGCSDHALNCVIAIEVAPDENGHPNFTTAAIDDTGDLDAVTESRQPE